ncbi:hypothetical protein TNIN_41251 [Trichonephila inaurata madagascariensis]|uniref:Uncharacterized protein n=1 Tax=Trichonephila inaurata madagascariensis TaxID=2747483 RepID=A0A8X7CKF1_9ARAC|nr:hypothetical protein TNIN_41251 [Trichonephila inaurata madagascariensis]
MRLRSCSLQDLFRPRPRVGTCSTPRSPGGRGGGKDCEKCGQGQDAGVGGCLGRKVMADAVENESPLFLPPGPPLPREIFRSLREWRFSQCTKGRFQEVKVISGNRSLLRQGEIFAPKHLTSGIMSPFVINFTPPASSNPFHRHHSPIQDLKLPQSKASKR